MKSKDFQLTKFCFDIYSILNYHYNEVFDKTSDLSRVICDNAKNISNIVIRMVAFFPFIDSSGNKFSICSITRGSDFAL